MNKTLHTVTCCYVWLLLLHVCVKIVCGMLTDFPDVTALLISF